MTSPLPAPRLPALDSSRIDPDALRVLQRLHEHGHEAYLVGGCVRDLLVGRTPKDFDVVSSASVPQVRALFPGSVAFGGRRFLVVHVRLGAGKLVEVASLKARVALETGEGPDARVIPDEELTDYLPEQGTLEQDAWTRDFTVNALFYDVASGKVIDHVQGWSDLQANRLRVIGDPETRLREVPGTLLRGARFATRLGMEFEPRTAEAMRRLGGELSRCSRDRLLSETLRGFGAGTGVAFLRLLLDLGWLPLLLPPVARHLEGGPEVQRRFFAQVEAVDRLICGGERLNELMLACALLLPVTATASGAPGAPEAMAAVLGELVRGVPQFAALPGHGQLLIATLHGVLRAPDSIPPGHPLLPDARRLASLLTGSRP
jgi:poly(A) polymerase